LFMLNIGTPSKVVSDRGIQSIRRRNRVDTQLCVIDNVTAGCKKNSFTR